jgi:DNA polymerase (family X)
VTFNTDLTKIFFEIADAFELKGIAWKPQAYRRAAFTINSIEDVREIYKRGGVEELKKIPSIGDAIASKIEEYIKTAHIAKHDELIGKLPEGIVNIMGLPGVGPSKAKKLYNKLKIKTIEQLKKAAEQGKIREIEGFGEKSEKEILLAISLGLKQKDRQPIEKILPIANKLIKKIKSWSEVIKAEPAGSLRRKEPTIGDIDIIISSKTPKKVTAKFVKLPEVKKIIAQGKTKAAVWLKNNFEVDIRVVDDSCYGAALQYFTGPKNFNIKTRKIAIKKGYKLSEYGLFNRKTGELIAGKTEKEIFEKLGLPYIKPEKEREEFSKN